MRTPYFQPYEEFTIAVHELATDRYDVVFMPKQSHAGRSIEVCLTERHAVEGAKKFHIFHRIAKENGFHMSHIGFKHNDGRELHYSYSMDLDMTEELFKSLLDRA